MNEITILGKFTGVVFLSGNFDYQKWSIIIDRNWITVFRIDKKKSRKSFKENKAIPFKFHHHYGWVNLIKSFPMQILFFKLRQNLP